jgi:hypothetical protein
MLTRLVKIGTAVAFLLLVSVPIAFYRSGPTAAVREGVFVIALFSLMSYLGHRWVRRFLGIDSLPTRIEDRILVGLALTTVYVFWGYAQVFLGVTTGLILGSLQWPFLTGLFSSGLNRQDTGERRAWEPGFWRKREYIPAMTLMAILSVILVAAFWSFMRWWALLAVPALLLGNGIGELIGRSLRRWLVALNQVWNIARRMGPPIGAFAMGYVVIFWVFATLFASVWRADSDAYKGLPPHPSFIDFAYYSVMTISTTGYGDVTPQSPTAKILASAEVLIGLGWTVVIFAAVLTVVQLQHPREPGTQTDGGRE